MKIFGIILLAIGTAWLVFAFNADTSVWSEHGFVVNLAKMQEQRNHIAVSSLLILAGIILLVFGIRSKNNPPAAEAINKKQKASTYYGERNIQSAKYQIFLMEKYSIQKNAALEKYIVDDNLFTTLEESLQYANDQETQKEAQEKLDKELQRLKTAYYVTYVAENSNAHSSGIKTNDIIMSYNGTPITNYEDLLQAISSASESTVNMNIYRGNEKIELSVKSGRLGVDGDALSLAPDIYEARIKNLLG